MIATKMLQPVSFFEFLTPPQIKAIAGISNEVSYDSGSYIFREKEYARELCILVQGSVDLFFTVDVEYHPELHKELLFSEIGPGEMFGISALVDPHILTSSARASKPCQVIKIDRKELQALCDQDKQFANGLMHQVAKTSLERLNATRLQLAAVWSTTTV
jgi:CRP-like cAMP-binding protein